MPSARPPLSRDRVVAEAMALADERGLTALSMRALAARHSGSRRCRSTTTSRQGGAARRHGRRRVRRDAPAPVVGGDWRAELRRAARGRHARSVLLRHRWAVGLMDSRRTPGPETLRHHDAVLGCLRAAGLLAGAAGTAFALLDAHLYGFMEQEVSLPFEGEADLAAGGRDARPEVPARPTRTSQPSPRAAPCSPVTPSATSSRSPSTWCSGASRPCGPDRARRHRRPEPRSRSASPCSASTAARPVGRGRARAGCPAATGGRGADRSTDARRDGARRRRVRWSASTSRSGCRTARSARPTCWRAGTCRAGPAPCSRP